jgi:hypothetical protein
MSISQPKPNLYKQPVRAGEVQRTPTWFANVQTAAAGQTAIHTPAAGYKFRLLGAVITLSKEAACAGAFSFQLQDAAANFMSYVISNAALVAIGNVVVVPIVLPSNGFLSGTTANVLNVNLSAALTAGLLSINAWGTDEAI